MTLTPPPDRRQPDLRSCTQPSAESIGTLSYHQAILTLLGLWLLLFVTALFSPPLLDDADATHASAARHIVLSGDWVTLHVNGIRYLEKAPLPYWLAAFSFIVFGFNTFAAHLPQALGVLLLALLGYRWAHEAYGPRTALYTGIATLTCTGVFLFTRIFIPEVLLSLFLCTALYCFLKSLDPSLLSSRSAAEGSASPATTLYPYALWTALALAVLTKGLVAVVFIFGTAIVYLVLTGDYKKWRALKPFTGALLLLVIAAPWHILAGLRNTGGMNGHGFFWFYFINEHVLRFLGTRIPRDYNKLPGYLFWTLHIAWLFPWALFLPLLFKVSREEVTAFRARLRFLVPTRFLRYTLVLIPMVAIATIFGYGARRFWQSQREHGSEVEGTGNLYIARRTTLLLALFSALVLVFFSLSTNQEYYTFPAYLPVLILIVAALTRAESTYTADSSSSRWITFAHATFTLIGIAAAVTLACGLWSARHLPFVPDIGDLLAHRGVGDYTLSMSHLFDLTGPSFAALRLPATLAALAFALGPAIAWLLRSKQKHIASTLTIALTSAVFLIAAHIALVRFGPMLSSQDLAEKIQELEDDGNIAPETQVLLYGDQSYGSSIVFYLHQTNPQSPDQPSDQPIPLVEGRSSSMLFGSSFPDSPNIFLSNDQLLKIWGAGPRKVLFVPLERRDAVDHLFGNHKILIEETSGKALYTDRPLDPSYSAPLSANNSSNEYDPMHRSNSLLSHPSVAIAALLALLAGLYLLATYLFKPTWNPRSIAILCIAWLTLQLGGIFTPGLLDDVDSIYIEIAREMLHRHDYVTPYIDGIRFFDKPPLIYWMASASMSVFGETDWAARIPLDLAVLALLLSVYTLGIRLFGSISPPDSPDRAGLYAALALATGIGPYLFTRFYIPDILLCLWMTLAVHLTFIAIDRRQSPSNQNKTRILVPHVSTLRHRILTTLQQSTLLPCLAFAAVLALNLLTKGLIGLVFPVAFVLLYLALTKQLRLLPKFHLLPSTAVFLAIAAPWHVLAALRNPAIALPSGIGLPAKGGWAWFYLYNEHFARFLSKRVPHDYGQTPVWLFWLFTAIWMMPWIAFLPAALSSFHYSLLPRARFFKDEKSAPAALPQFLSIRSANVALLLWVLLVLGFFSISARQEYYGLPALPALGLLAGGVLALADGDSSNLRIPFSKLHADNLIAKARRSALRWSLWLLVPLTTLIAAICGYFAITSPKAPPGTDLATLLSNNPELYNLSLGHLYDLTGTAMGLFHGPLAAVALSMIAIGPLAYLLRRARHTYAANLTLAAGMTVALLASHEGLVRFNPILGSKDLAEAINHTQQTIPCPNDLILLDGELTSGSTLLFYTRQQVHLIDGRVNGLWYGSFWPDAPQIFETEASLRTLWPGPRRIFLFTSNPAPRTKDLTPLGPVHLLASAGGKTILTNR